MFGRKTNLEKALELLEKVKKEENGVFVKIYFANSENYSIKFINEDGKLIKTYRKDTEKKWRAFDLRK